MLFFSTNERHGYYVVNDAGCIAREDFTGNRTVTFSGNWLLVGIRHTRRNEFIPFSELKDKLPTLDLRFKNGRGQYHIVDKDHGTKRLWSARINHMYFTEDK